MNDDAAGKVRRKSYTAEFKLKVCKYAEQTSNRAAGRQFGVPENNVRRWRNETIKLTSMKKSKRANRRKAAKYPQLERELRQWILNKRRN